MIDERDPRVGAIAGHIRNLVTASVIEGITTGSSIEAAAASAPAIAFRLGLAAAFRDPEWALWWLNQLARIAEDDLEARGKFIDHLVSCAPAGDPAPLLVAEEESDD